MKKKTQGHYCKVCDAYKSNESFSGKGHNSHICKKCSSLSPAEQSKEITLNKIYNIGFGRLSKEQKRWLENRTKDDRPEVREAALEVYNNIFPYAEINKRKKQLILKEFSLFVNAKIYDDGDYENINCKFHISDNGIRKEDETEHIEIKLPKSEIRKLLRIIIHNYEVFTWGDNDTIFDKFDINIPHSWQIECLYSTAEKLMIVGNNEYLDDNVEELFFELNSYFD